MKKIAILGLFVLLFVCSVFAQSSADKPSMLFETVYIQAKQGMSEKFEAAIKAHNTKFHPDGEHKAGLRKIEYGDKAGWYVWVMGPSTFKALDTRPTTENGHETDWTTNVDPLVEKYGKVQLWKFNSDLSVGVDKLKKDKYYEAWMVKVKPGQYYRFKSIAEKLKKAYESKGNSSFLVYNNVIHTTNSADLGILWSFNSYEEWAEDPGTKTAYEKLYGANSWQNMIDEWMDLIVSYDTEIRSIIK
jgi:hypothetical protein